MSCKIIVHGGAGGTSPRARREVRKAARKGMEILQDGGSALDAVVAAVVHMEDIEVFNAGVGSMLRKDGITIEMDAAVATSEGLQAGVGAIRGVRHPVLLALQVARDKAVRFLSGEGATEMAERLGLDQHPGASEEAIERWKRMQDDLERDESGVFSSGQINPDGVKGKGRNPVSAGNHDTVGAIALDATGIFALASSTGGSGNMPVGRVGDVPLEGDGFQIGNRGGVLATGVGEVISELHGSRRAYQRLQGGIDPQVACQETVAVFPEGVDIGFIALTRHSKGIATAKGCPMVSWSITEP